MRIFSSTAASRGTAAALALAGVFVAAVGGRPAGLALVTPAMAQDMVQGYGAEGHGHVRYPSALVAYRIGVRAYATGNMAQAISALEHAMEKGLIRAKLLLARIYLRGQGLPHEPAVAFRYFREIADDYADISPNHRAAPYVAAAFVELGKFHQRGDASLGLEADDARAADYFVHAASLFGHAEAQYLLARLYLKGAGVPKNVRLARHWLVSASKKGYAPAQAYLGQLLWQGRVLRRRPVKALALITLARVNAQPDDREWIEVIYRNIIGQALPKHAKRARAVVARWRRVYTVRRRPADADASADVRLDVDEKARGIEVRPYRPGEGTEGDSGQIMASPSTLGGIGGAAARQGDRLADRVRPLPKEENRLGIMQGDLSGAGALGLRNIGADMPGR